MSHFVGGLRFFRPKIGHFVVAALAAELFLWICEGFKLFVFAENKGWAVLISVVIAGAISLGILFVTLICRGRARLLRYKFRFLLLSAVVVAFPFWWLRAEMLQADRQRIAVAEFVSAGGEANYYGVAAPDILVKLLGKDFFDYPTDARLWEPTDSKRAIALLPRFDRLRTTMLVGRKFDDTDIQLLADNCHLAALKLVSTGVTDFGIEYLASRQQFYALAICDTPVSDAGIDCLKAQRGLRRLELFDTKVTDNLERQLRIALPSCEFGFSHYP